MLCEIRLQGCEVGDSCSSQSIFPGRERSDEDVVVAHPTLGVAVRVACVLAEILWLVIPLVQHRNSGCALMWESCDPRNGIVLANVRGRFRRHGESL